MGMIIFKGEFQKKDCLKKSLKSVDNTSETNAKSKKISYLHYG